VQDRERKKERKTGRQDERRSSVVDRPIPDDARSVPLGNSLLNDVAQQGNSRVAPPGGGGGVSKTRFERGEHEESGGDDG
jgi:hypothetical protein